MYAVIGGLYEGAPTVGITKNRARAERLARKAHGRYLMVTDIDDMIVRQKKFREACAYLALTLAQDAAASARLQPVMPSGNGWWGRVSWAWKFCRSSISERWRRGNAPDC